MSGASLPRMSRAVEGLGRAFAQIDRNEHDRRAAEIKAHLFGEKVWVNPTWADMIVLSPPTSRRGGFGRSGRSGGRR